jgi:hypothetical protein
MTYQECKNQVLKLLNQYTIAGNAVADGYNNQADYIRRIPSLINDAMMEISTTVRKIEAQCELRVGGVTPLSIVQQPVDATGELGTYVTFYVQANGDGLTYMWQSNTKGYWSDTSFKSSRNAKLTVKVTEARDGKSFRCRVADQYGNTLYSSAALLHVGTPVPTPTPTPDPTPSRNTEGDYISLAEVSDHQAQFVLPHHGDGVFSERDVLRGALPLQRRGIHPLKQLRFAVAVCAAEGQHVEQEPSRCSAEGLKAAVQHGLILKIEVQCRFVDHISDEARFTLVIFKPHVIRSAVGKQPVEIPGK